MPNLPSAKPESTPLTEREKIIARLIAHGRRPNEIAKLLEPEDLKKRRALRLKLWKQVREDARMGMAIGQAAHTDLLLGLGPATTALVKRAERGRPDAIKLVYEASGFHNPRVKHEHSGDINVNLNIPRPKRVQGVADDVVDAEVVEEE